LARQDDAIAELATKGIEVIEPDDISQFVEKVSGVYGDNEARIGAELIEMARTYAAA
jgi:TRAP-type C4-dicarboxylate transport system substrate-binding protein